MKKVYFAIIFIAVQAYISSAIAGTDVENGKIYSELDLNLELSLIKKNQAAIESKTKAREANCYKQFIVNSCLADIQAERLTEINAIKKREIEINQQLRAIKARSILEKKIKLNAKDMHEFTADLKVEKNKNSTNVDMNSQRVPRIGDDPKQSSEKQRESAAKKRVEKTNKKVRAAEKKAQLRSIKQSQAAANNNAYIKKLQDAEDRKNAVIQKQLANKKPKSMPLPIPTANEITQ